jgi:hypothetical protein
VWRREEHLEGVHVLEGAEPEVVDIDHHAHDPEMREKV